MEAQTQHRNLLNGTFQKNNNVLSESLHANNCCQIYSKIFVILRFFKLVSIGESGIKVFNEKSYSETFFF